MPLRGQITVRSTGTSGATIPIRDAAGGPATHGPPLPFAWLSRDQGIDAPNVGGNFDLATTAPVTDASELQSLLAAKGAVAAVDVTGTGAGAGVRRTWSVRCWSIPEAEGLSTFTIRAYRAFSDEIMTNPSSQTVVPLLWRVVKYVAPASLDDLHAASMPAIAAVLGAFTEQRTSDSDPVLDAHTFSVAGGGVFGIDVAEVPTPSQLGGTRSHEFNNTLYTSIESWT